ncbi:VOC family protein [Arthrobacter dokdonensis]
MDPDATVEFYTEVLGLQLPIDRRISVQPYIALTRGTIHANSCW